MRFEPKLGTEFPVDAVQLVKAKTSLIREITRSAIALVAIVGGGLALLGTAAVGLFIANWSPFLIVWPIIGSILGLLFWHYFPRHQTNEEDDEGTARAPRHVDGAPESASRQDRGELLRRGGQEFAPPL